MVWETWFRSLVASYQRFLKWYLIPPCLILSNIRFVSRVKWSNPGKGVAPSPRLLCSSYWKGSLLVALDYGRQLTYKWERCDTRTIFLAELNWFGFRVFLLTYLLPNQGWRTHSSLLFAYSWMENKRIHTFPKTISAKWNAIKLDPDLNSGRHVYFQSR